jgi:alginate O-acetyltransferase complex protein AlgJ
MPETISLPAGGPTREEIAKIEIGHTNVSPAIARALTAFFMIAIFAVPIVETVVPRWLSGEAPTVWARLAAIPGSISAAFSEPATGGSLSLWNRAVAANREAIEELVGFESALEDESVLGRTLRPPAQRLLSSWPGAGNERVYVGRRDEQGARWLFYRADLEYVTNQGFLDEEVLERRIDAASEYEALPQPDPRPAILAFHQDLAARGITLILVPTPVKPGVHPEQLVDSIEADETLQNPSYASLIDELRAAGIPVFEPGDVLFDARRAGHQYLATDTHWRPEAMELVARDLAAFVTDHVDLPAATGARYVVEQQEATATGDTAAMLDLPDGQQLYPPEQVLLRRVVTDEGGAWRSDQRADVLVLGDSFSNIYSLASMGWGDSAGLVEHLSFALERPLDRIVQNADAAFATRELLARAGAGRLSGKRVVIWQFAARELAFGDWKVIQFP